jgi:hypothetical protein
MSLEEQSKEMKEAIAGAMLHATILLWSIAEEIEKIIQNDHNNSKI